MLEGIVGSPRLNCGFRLQCHAAGLYPRVLERKARVGDRCCDRRRDWPAGRHPLSGLRLGLPPLLLVFVSTTTLEPISNVTGLRGQIVNVLRSFRVARFELIGALHKTARRVCVQAHTAESSRACQVETVKSRKVERTSMGVKVQSAVGGKQKEDKEGWHYQLS